MDSFSNIVLGPHQLVPYLYAIMLDQMGLTVLNVYSLLNMEHNIVNWSSNAVH